MKHTPGPWFACCVDEYPHYVFGEEADKTICALCSNDPNDHDHEYERHEGVVTLEERRANARLIAAAPELLEALKLCVERLKYYEEYEHGEAIIADAEAVIAKAEGTN